MDTPKKTRDYFSEKFATVVAPEEEFKDPVSVIIARNTTNVVSGEKLRVVQEETLASAKEFLSKTFGPMGSNTKIIKGENIKNINSSYSKDGLKVLENIINSGPIEASIIEELIDITKHVEKEVGDGTTSTVILSSLIFSKLIQLQRYHNVPPYELMRRFDNIVERIKNNIISHGKECTLEDIYQIASISTNNNQEVSTNIADIYENYGMNVDLSVGISNTSDSLIKEYDGLTITEGMSDPVYITDKTKGICDIRNAHIYHFADPIDNMEMISLFESILSHNIYETLANDEVPIPTVITCPRLSRDMSASLKMLAEQLYQFDTSGMQAAKPPILIITDVVASDELIMDDIANLCGCKTIRKYLDPNMLKRDQESGIAPTVENVATDFCGYAEQVVSDAKKTKFINPKHMHVYNEDGTVTDDPIYSQMVEFLEREIENEKATGTAGDIGLLKKRLAGLKANSVDYLVGGVTIADRDATKDLVEDAIKNCKSASLYGVGYAANFEGLRSSCEVLDEITDEEESTMLDIDIAGCIYSAYCDIAEILYGTVSTNKEEIEARVFHSIIVGKPYDISGGYLPDLPDYSDNVKCSIMLDVNILDTISKIITLMVTCNQCLLQGSNINKY